MKEAVELILKKLVRDHEAVDVREVERDRSTTVIEVRVAQSDVGKIIGRQGRTVKALRSLLTALGIPGLPGLAPGPPADAKAYYALPPGAARRLGSLDVRHGWTLSVHFPDGEAHGCILDRNATVFSIMVASGYLGTFNLGAQTLSVLENVHAASLLEGSVRWGSSLRNRVTKSAVRMQAL